MVKNKQTGGDVYYLPAHQTANVTLPFSSYVIIENGSIISTVVSREHHVEPIYNTDSAYR